MKKLLQKNKEILLYLVFGVLTTLVNWGIYTVCVLTMSIALANCIAWAGSVLFAYLTNKLFVFESRSMQGRTLVKEFALFVGARLISGVIEMAGVPLLYYCGVDQSVLGVDGFLAKILVSVIVVVLNYVLSKLLIFKNTKKSQ